MIRFYRSINTFYAITIDLDDTLYNNDPVIFYAEEKLLSFLRKYHPALSEIQKKDYYFFRKLIKLMDPEIYHDVNFWRWKALEKTLLKFGLSKHDAQLGSDCAMDIIIYWRNQISIPIQTYNILSALQTKWPLIAITNGNSDPVFYGLKKYFLDILRAGVHGRAKPYTDMYFLASKYFDLPCKYILHVGDNLKTDILGSIKSGVQSCWLNKYYVDSRLSKIMIDVKLFPNIEISELMLLTYFL